MTNIRKQIILNVINSYKVWQRGAPGYFSLQEMINRFDINTLYQITVEEVEKIMLLL